MKKNRPKPAPAFPRRRWQLSPVTRIKDSGRRYSRPRTKQQLRHDQD
jgi:hypothetical protein